MNDTEPLTPPPADVDALIADAFSKRPEILALEFQSESAEKLHQSGPRPDVSDHQRSGRIRRFSGSR